MEFGFGQEPGVEDARPQAGLDHSSACRGDLRNPRVAIASGSVEWRIVFQRHGRARTSPATIPGDQNDDVVAFKDITPQAPTHVLVVPRRHVASLNELGPDDDALVRSDGASRCRDRVKERARTVGIVRCFMVQFAFRTPARRYSTSTFICSVGARWRGRRGRKGSRLRGSGLRFLRQRILPTACLRAIRKSTTR